MTKISCPECSKCGAIKEGSYKKESWCGKCTGERRKLLRERRRLEKGLPPIGSGRDPKCKICRADKEPSYQNGPWCKACKCASEKARYEAKKAELGLPDRRSGRNPICKCGTEKIDPTSAYCSSCNAERKRQARLKKKEDPDFVKKEREKYHARLEKDIFNRIKKNCREATHRRIRAGILVKQPCEVCGTNEMIEAHHDDYSKPLEVRWLCSRHHHDHHMKIDKEIKNEC